MHKSAALASETPYILSFTAASLRPELARIVAEHALDADDWEEAKRTIRETNALQARSKQSARLLLTEMSQRVRTLTPRQLDLLATGASDDRVAMAWLAVLKQIRFAADFATGPLRDKLAARDPVLRPSDYVEFIREASITHPELDEISASTQNKIRQVLLSMLTEAGLLGKGRTERPILRPVLSPDARDAILADDRAWLAGFLYADEDLARL